MKTGRILLLLIFCFCSACSTLPNHFDPATEPNAKAVVFDVDGTLTPTVLRFWQARDDAAKAVRYYFEQGYKIFYLTARIPLFQSQLPGWLEDHGFPQGSLFLSQNSDDRHHPTDFKTRILRRLIQDGWQIEFAFGDSSTDFAAYAAVNIPAAQVFALQRECADECEPGAWAHCFSDWKTYLESAQAN